MIRHAIAPLLMATLAMLAFCAVIDAAQQSARATAQHISATMTQR